MTTRRNRRMGFSRAALVAVSWALCAGLAGARAQPLEVMVSILPLKFFVERIATGHVHVNVMVGANMSPETFEPTPRLIAAASGADLFFAAGVPFERGWLGKLRANAPGLRIIDCGPEDESARAFDAHAWTSPREARRIARRIAAALVSADPVRAEGYQRNLGQLIEDLDRVEADVRDILAARGTRSFLVYHPAWEYFARDFGLEQIAIEHDGKAPRARHLAAVLERARAQGLSTVFVQRQLGSASAQSAARELGGRVVEIDPLAEDYLDNLRRVAAAIAGKPS
ncbi:MAG: zinc ABC transporter substrate-binding protein [Gammaproteobacteria bacterium]|nr:zinc ABC transporter substrate-binding protein [Gammaproteobacteria bacterium]